MPLGRDNYLTTLEFLKGVSKSTQAVCLSGDFFIPPPRGDDLSIISGGFAPLFICSALLQS